MGITDIAKLVWKFTVPGYGYVLFGYGGLAFYSIVRWLWVGDDRPISLAKVVISSTLFLLNLWSWWYQNKRKE